MKKLFILLLLMLFSFSVDAMIQEDKIDNKQVMKDLHKIHNSMDSAFYEMKQCGIILKNEVKTYGLKKTIQINSWLFLPLFIFFIMYLGWLKNRKK